MLDDEFSHVLMDFGCATTLSGEKIGIRARFAFKGKDYSQSGLPISSAMLIIDGDGKHDVLRMRESGGGIPSKFYLTLGVLHV